MKGCQPYEMPQCEHHVPGKLQPCSSLPDYYTPKCKTECSNPAYTTPFKSDHHTSK